LVVLQVPLTVVAVDPVTEQVTPPPAEIDVAPARFVPVRVTATFVVLCVSVAGENAVSVGPCTVKELVRFGLVPFGVVMLTFLALSVAPVVIVNVAVTSLELTTVTPLAVTPVPDTVIAVAPVRSEPMSVTETAVPRTPVFGETEVSVGPSTVKVTLPLVPPGVVIVTVLAESPAVAEMANVAVTEVELTTVKPLTVTPAPDTVMAEAPVRLVPVRDTLTLVPR
jgi:hypothetical protein